MDLYANLRARVKISSITHVRRSLLGRGRLNVKVGMEVIPEDILGMAEQSAGFFVVELAKKLQVPPKTAKKYLVREVGTKIYKGELLAKRRSFLGEKYLTSPTDGVIELYDENKGELMLRYPPKNSPLYSGVFGIVDQVNEGIGEVVLKTVVSEVIGVYGSGLERGGNLIVLTDNGGLVSGREISPKLSKQIVVTGALVYGEAIRRAAELGVYGIVSGGLNARDFKAMSGSLEPMLRVGADPGISIIATEGFGALPIGDDIFKTILSHEGKFAFISGNSSRLLLPSTDPDSIMRLRQVVLPLKRGPDATSEVNLSTVKVGAKVRIIWPPFAGWQATVIGIDQRPTKLPSGISTFDLLVETKGRKLKVPFTNVELI